MDDGPKRSTASPIPPPPRVGETIGGKYTLVLLLGRGGMGEVYEAIAPDGTHVAVKLLRAGADSHDLVRRFEREGRAVLTIDDPHVIRVLELGRTGARSAPFLAMELLSGSDLATILRQSGPIEPGAAAQLFVQACRGLAAAHARGIVHRDVKPSNLFLQALPGGRIRLKVCDFGIAKATGSTAGPGGPDLTRTGGLLGSPAYMSPEQLRDARAVDHRADLWSLAIALYEALSGARPFRSASGGADIMVSICNDDTPPLVERAPWVDPALAAVVHRALSRRIEERYPTATSLGEALLPFAAPAETLSFPTLPTRESVRAHAHARRLLSEETTSPAPPSISMGMGSAAFTSDLRTGRRPWLFAGATAVLALASGVAAFSVLRHRARLVVAPYSVSATIGNASTSAVVAYSDADAVDAGDASAAGSARLEQADAR